MEQAANANTEGRQWNYSPAMQFFARFINVALIDCGCALGIVPVAHGELVACVLPTHPDPAARPSDDALLARDWLARSESATDRKSRRYLSFADCCAALGVDEERSRMNLLAAVDAAGDYDSDEAWARLEALNAMELADDAEPLFDAPRVVPAVDQMALF